ncbi:hypothetical protein AB0J72_30830 [Dactylosporangium sp. NPDC049742]|uniref:hypothetical protein n=1 Tax=Dactylosporangium sp. NPDC049742 TaxID=3154737 RepID=UPI0034210709
MTIDRDGTGVRMRVFTVADSVLVTEYVVRRQRDAVRESVSAAVFAVLPSRRIRGDHSGPARGTPFARHGAGRGAPMGGRRQVWGPARRRGAGRSPACVNGTATRGR